MEAAITKAEDFLGLSKFAAQAKAENRNMIFRLIKVDDKEFFAYPSETDIRTDRVCCELEGGKVVKAVLQ